MSQGEVAQLNTPFENYQRRGVYIFVQQLPKSVPGYIACQQRTLQVVIVALSHQHQNEKHSYHDHGLR